MLQAMDIDTQIVRRDPLAVERVDAAGPAEVMTGGLRVELVFGEFGFAGEELEPGLVHLDHQCVLAAADRTVALGQLGKVRLDLEADRATVTAADVLSQWPLVHGFRHGGFRPPATWAPPVESASQCGGQRVPLPPDECDSGFPASRCGLQPRRGQVEVRPKMHRSARKSAKDEDPYLP